MRLLDLSWVVFRLLFVARLVAVALRLLSWSRPWLGVRVAVGALSTCLAFEIPRPMLLGAL